MNTSKETMADHQKPTWKGELFPLAAAQPPTLLLLPNSSNSPTPKGGIMNRVLVKHGVNASRGYVRSCAVQAHSPLAHNRH